MPIYEFKCPDCKKVFEITKRMEDMPQSHPCPDCGRDSPKIFSRYDFQFSPYLKEFGGDNIVSY